MTSSDNSGEPATSSGEWMDVKWHLDPVAQQHLPRNSSELCVDGGSVEVLTALDKIWNGPEKSFEELKKCTVAESRYILRKTRPIQEVYDLGKQLGNPGTYGSVQSCKCKETGADFAVKIIHKWKFKNPELTTSFFQDLRNEVRLLKMAHDHPAIINIYEVFETIDNLYIIMNSCTGGELFEQIQSDDGFTEDKAAKIFGQMLSAVFYIHQMGIMHCDLKPENFIFETREAKKIQLIDFGMAKIVRWREYYKRMNGTPYYIAPEVLAGKYNRACDMWSMGVILFILVFGYPPFFEPTPSANKNDSYKVIYRKIRQGFTPKVKPGYGAWFPKDIPVSNEYKDLVARLLRDNVASRMTAEEALAHPWIVSQTTGERNNPIPMIRSMRYMRHSCALQSEILKVLADCKFLNRDQEESVREMFQRFDKNGDGVIDKDELYAAIIEIDPRTTKEDALQIIRACDFNSDAGIDLEEMLGARICHKIGQKEERLKKLFRCLDLDDSGSLNATEIVAALESVRGETIPIEEATKLIESVDENHDGQIDYEEFLKMFITNRDITDQ